LEVTSTLILLAEVEEDGVELADSLPLLGKEGNLRESTQQVPMDLILILHHHSILAQLLEVLLDLLVVKVEASALLDRLDPDEAVLTHMKIEVLLLVALTLRPVLGPSTVQVILQSFFEHLQLVLLLFLGGKTVLVFRRGSHLTDSRLRIFILGRRRFLTKGANDGTGAHLGKVMVVSQGLAWAVLLDEAFRDVLLLDELGR